MRRTIQVLGFLTLVLVPASAWGDARSIATAARPQVVRITSTFGGDQPTTKHGFGFVVGERGGSLYIATANHVVRLEADDAVASATRVQFFYEQGISHEAVVLETHRRAPTDLAVLTVSKPLAAPALTLCDDGKALRRNTPSAYVGRDGDWYVPTLEGSVNSFVPDETFHAEVDFSRTVAVKEGTSGGPLVSPRGLMGMVIQDSNSNVATVLGLDAIARAFQGWNHPWDVQPCDRPPLPTGRFQLGFSTGYGLPFGNADGGVDGNLAHFTRGSFPFSLAGLYHLSSELLVGVVVDYAALLDSADRETGCTDCGGSVFRVAIVGRYQLALGPRFRPWAGLGVGYDQMSVKGESPITWRGIEIVRLDAGADLAIAPTVTLGPFVSFSVSYYQKTGDQAAGVPGDYPMWLAFGLRTTVLIR